MRPITGREELGLFCELHYVLNDEVADDLGAGRRRPEWMWVALDDERVVARVAWWGAVDTTPEILDIVDIDDHATAPERLHIGVRLLQTARGAVLGNATSVPDYSRFVPPDWRQDDASRRIVEDRITMLEQSARASSSSACASNGASGRRFQRRAPA